MTFKHITEKNHDNAIKIYIIQTLFQFRNIRKYNKKNNQMKNSIIQKFKKIIKIQKNKNII